MSQHPLREFYAIHRFCRGRETVVRGKMTDLDATCELALELQQRDADPDAKYLVIVILGQTAPADAEPKDRHGDLALVARKPDELGIPAQWGKGRRNRKGWYLP